ncbi:MAG: NUDIX hydrolase [Deltaproteobacteria bacterium]
MSGIYSGSGRLGRWQRLGSETIAKTRVFDVHKETKRSPRTGQNHDFFVIEASDWVNIVPLTASGEVVLIRQYRHGIADFTLEIPGGMIDPEDASPAAAARREMQEETGYDSEDIRPLGWVHPNPAIQGNRTFMFAAYGAERRMETHFDTTEEIEVICAPLGKIPQLILEEKISHALVISAFHRLGLPPQQSGGS